jgi:lipoyl-dependent peroxiredoxin
MRCSCTSLSTRIALSKSSRLRRTWKQHHPLHVGVREGLGAPLHEKVGNMKTLYTAEAVVEGGRQGHGRTSDGRLEVDLSVPEGMGGRGGVGTNPEQLFAVGYAACFQSALLNVANGRKLDASDSRIISRVGLGPTGHGGMGLTVALDLHAPHLSPAEAADLMARAHDLCPYSNATRGNIDVSLTIDGASLEDTRAS